MTCGLCKQEAVDSMGFETGNNAELAVDVNLCQEHLEEQEKTGYAFEQKYDARLTELAYQRMGF